MDCVKVCNNEITVNITDYVKLDGYCQHMAELYRTLHLLTQDLKTKTLRFNFAMDCQPIRFFALDRVFEHIATTYDMPRDRMILDIWDHVPLTESQWITVNTQPSTAWLIAENHVNVQRCVKNPDAKLFGGFYGRFTPHRFLMAYFLETMVADQSVVKFHPSVKWAEYEFESVRKYYDKEFAWLHQRSQQKITEITPGYNGRIDMHVALQEYHRIFAQCHMEIVLETNHYDNGWFSEKTTRCLISGKPFILMGVQGQLDHLRRIGFQTFDPWINESYDQESNPELRFDKIQDEIQRIVALNADQQAELVREIDQIAAWNQRNYKRLVTEYFETFKS
jgi:hypothetical protein